MREDILLSDGLWYSKQEIDEEIMRSRRIIGNIELVWANWINGCDSPDDDIKKALELTKERACRLLKMVD